MNHDVIVIGGSAGAIEIMLNLVPEIPTSFRASFFVVIHTSPSGPSSLPELLSRRGPLLACHPVHGEEILPGRIYVAPPDNHLLVRRGSMDVVRGARENGHRPAVDPTFRSASASYGSRVVGVVLSGHQDCGTAGMMSIKARGGVSVVQDPDSAVAREMPQNVIDRVSVDHVVAPGELSKLLISLSRAPAGPEREPDEYVQQLEGTRAGKRAELVCPTCQGVLSEAEAGKFKHFRCHVGHAFSLESLVREQSEETERALWAAARSLEESAALSRRVSDGQGNDIQRRLAEKATTQARQADLIRGILLNGGNVLTQGDAPRRSSS